MAYIKSFSVGDGDSFYIEHGSDNFSIIDCGFCDDDQVAIVKEIKERSNKKNIIRVIITHPDDDHISGLPYLDSQLKIVNFYCVENDAKKDQFSEAFDKYCELRDGTYAFYLKKGCRRKWMNWSDEERGNAGISILWPEVDNEYYKQALKNAADGGSPNNISPIIKYELKHSVTAVWMGDLESEFMSNIEDRVELPSTDILFAPHHGRSSGRPPKSWLETMNPKLIVIGEAESKDLDYYNGYLTICQNTAGDIAFDCVENYIHIYAENPYAIDGLENKNKPSLRGLDYVGSLGL